MEASQLGRIEGEGKPPSLEGAEVEVRDSRNARRYETVTDGSGIFSVELPSPGVFEIRVTHPGFLPNDWQRVEVGSEETVSVEIRLGRNVVPLDPLIVVARTNRMMAGFYERQSRGISATFLTREDIDARGAGMATDLLRGLPGVRIDFVRWGFGPSIEMQGAFGPCIPAIFVDGVEVPPSEGIGASLNDYITPDRIEGVEVYSSFSTVPVEYLSGMCGVILIWSRRGLREGGEPWGWKRMLIGFGTAIALLVWII